MVDEDDRFVPAAELAERLAKKEQTLAAWRSEGKGPKYHKIGRAVFYRESAIRNWLNGQERIPTPAAERGTSRRHRHTSPEAA